MPGGDETNSTLSSITENYAKSYLFPSTGCDELICQKSRLFVDGFAKSAVDKVQQFAALFKLKIEWNLHNHAEVRVPH